MDEELLGEFLTESNENLAAIEQQLMSLEANPQDSELLDSIFRTIHTVKGSCGFLKLTHLEKVAHAGENLLSRIRSLKYEVDESIVSLLLECADAITQLLEGLGETGKEPVLDHSSLIARLQACERMVSGETEPNSDEVAVEVETQDITWLPDFEAPILDALKNKNLITATDVITAGFATLRNVEPLTPADALKILGIARTAVNLPGQSELSVAKEANGKDEKPNKAPKREAAAEIQEEEVATVSDEEVKTAEVEPEQPATEQAEAKQPETKQETQTTMPVQSKKPQSNASIRVDIGLLDELMNQVGELVLTRNSLVQMVRASGSMELMRVSRDVDQITEQLQEQLLRTRMQPIQTIWSSVPRIVRDIGKQLDKKIKVVMQGEETELDRTILNALKDPLTHIIRNSCDHGIETPGIRREKNKPEQGTLKLSAEQESGFISILIHDDGGGIDAESIKKKAVKMGVLNQEQADNMTKKAALQLIFHAGLSTAEKVTNFSGRGVGMDVVRTEIERVGGSVVIDSTVGEGTTIRIRIPLTLAIISAMVVECEGQRYAIPQMSVQELLSTPEDSDDWRLIADQPFFRLRGKLLPIMLLKNELDLSSDTKLSGSIVVVDLGDRTYGILVDKIFGAEEIVVKPLGVHFQHLNFYGGCSILGDGTVIPIFDCNGLASLMQLSAEVDISKGVEEDDFGQVDSKQHSLLFNQAGMRYAIPMTLVERLEFLPPEQIEKTATGEILQYRGEVITVLRWADLIGVPATNKAEGEEIYCLILSDGDSSSGKRMCLQVDEVEDILEVPMDIKKSSDNPLFMGTTVIQEHATEVVNVFEIVQRADPNWFVHHDKGYTAKVLFVEDAQFFRQLVIPVLESMGLVIRVAEDGAKAKEVLASYTPDLILTDIEMPNVNGIELAKWVKTQPALAQTTVVALTGKQGFDDQSVDSSLFSGVLSKMDSQTLRESINQILENCDKMKMKKTQHHMTELNA
ncbi:MAG: chemotaxis protein CheW [Ghiorsea sp.]